MFEIDDDFLKSVGFHLDIMSDEQKEAQKQRLNGMFERRLIERFMPEMDDEQIEELNDIQSNPDRANRWLDEFHADYRDHDDYKQLREVSEEDEANTFYASMLWMSYAVPNFGELIQEELVKFQIEMADRLKN